MVCYEVLIMSAIAVEHDEINVENKAMNLCIMGFFSNKEREWTQKQQWSEEIKKSCLHLKIKPHSHALF